MAYSTLGSISLRNKTLPGTPFPLGLARLTRNYPWGSLCATLIFSKLLQIKLKGNLGEDGSQVGVIQSGSWSPMEQHGSKAQKAPLEDSMSGSAFRVGIITSIRFFLSVYSFLATWTLSFFRMKILDSEKACTSGFRIRDNFCEFLRVMFGGDNWLKYLGACPLRHSFSYTKSFLAHLPDTCQIQRMWVTKSSKVHRSSTRKHSTWSCCSHGSWLDFIYATKMYWLPIRLFFLIR